MTLDADTCYRALVARDRRFDGVFFVAVATTGIYCRPVCSARTPRRDRCAFFRSAVEAERAGYRACFRCRPELAPGRAPQDAVSQLVARAAVRIDEGALNDGSVDDLAAELGVTGRHLRRAFDAELGVAPVALAQSRRLALAKQLLHDTRLPAADVAFASGFGSVRRFNAAVRAGLGAPPSALRRGVNPAQRGERGQRRSAARSASTARAPASDRPRRASGEPGKPREPGEITLRLGYRPPLAWSELLGFLAPRAIPGVERAGDGQYARTVHAGDARGVVRVEHDAAGAAVIARVSLSLAGATMWIASRLRALFDLDAEPAAIDGQLARDRSLRALVARRPGLRVPGAFDGFELAVRAVLGQQTTVRGATTLAGRLVARLGEPLADAGAGLTHTFPGAAALVDAGPAAIAALGMPRARASALWELARAAAGGALPLERGAAVDEALAALEALPGVGPWTSHYVAMRALRWPDAFPAADLGLRKALGGASAAQVRDRAERWRPWRAYAAMHLWYSLED